MDLLVARIADERARARARVERMRAALPALVDELAARGATRVVLFGSLARGDEPHDGTDLDLLVTGLDLGAAYQAGCDLGALVDGPVDVVPAEMAGPRLLRAVERDGIVLLDADREAPRVPG